MQLGGGGGYAYVAARFDSNTLIPQGEAVTQGWARLGVVLETEVWEAGLRGARTQDPGMEQTLALRFQFWKKAWSLLSLLESEDDSG